MLRRNAPIPGRSFFTHFSLKSYSSSRTSALGLFCVGWLFRERNGWLTSGSEWACEVIARPNSLEIIFR